MQIEDLDAADAAACERCAQLLVEGFRHFAPEAWPTLAEARDTVDECLRLGPVRIARVSADAAGIAGWTAARPAYARVWELHPMVVAPSQQRRGVGRALVADLERIVAARGAMTLVLGSDDETGLTSVAGIDLYPDPLAHLSRLQDRGGHPFVFWESCGFVITGITPDANGFGQPDLHMAKRVGSMPDLPRE